MDIPITLYYFEKLAIYERCKRGDRLTTKRKTWISEEVLLRWSVREHEHLQSVLTIEDAKKELMENQPIGDNSYKGIDASLLTSIIEIEKIFENLEQKGLGITQKQNGKTIAIHFTEKGRAWGDVLTDIYEGNSSKYEITSRALKFLVILIIINSILKAYIGILEVLYPL